MDQTFYRASATSRTSAAAVQGVKGRTFIARHVRVDWLVRLEKLSLAAANRVCLSAAVEVIAA
jgi:hypothetical protein